MEVGFLSALSKKKKRCFFKVRWESGHFLRWAWNPWKWVLLLCLLLSCGSLENLCFWKWEMGQIFLIQALQWSLSSMDVFSLPQNKELHHWRSAAVWWGAAHLDYFRRPVNSDTSSEVYSLVLNAWFIKLHLSGLCRHGQSVGHNIHLSQVLFLGQGLDGESLHFHKWGTMMVNRAWWIYH